MGDNVESLDGKRRAKARQEVDAREQPMPMFSLMLYLADGSRANLVAQEAPRALFVAKQLAMEISKSGYWSGTTFFPGHAIIQITLHEVPPVNA